jgi:hypothetical protein
MLMNKSDYKANEDNLVLLAKSYAAAVKKQILGVDEQERKVGKQLLAPSRATKCLKQSFFKHQGTIAEPPTPRRNLTFWWGDITEASLLFLVAHCGVEIVGAQELITIGVGNSPKSQMKGFSDLRVKSASGKICLGEVKSMTGFTWKTFRDAGQKGLPIPDAFGYGGQVHSYLRGELEAGNIDPPGWGFILAFNKDTGAIYELWVKYDPSVGKLIDKNHDILHEHVEKKQLPPRLISDGFGKHVELVPQAKYTGRKPNKILSHYELPIQCQYCDWKYPCWEGRLPERYDVGDDGQCVPVWKKGSQPKKHKLELEFGNDRFGGSKPIWKITEV